MSTGSQARARGPTALDRGDNRMSKAKTNALDALRALIAERQQYEQWISALESKREGTPEHVFERVQADYRGRLDRVVTDIKGYAEELQLSISTLSSRLVEVAREEDTRREGLQEAELRAAVGEYEPQQWDELRRDAEQSLEKIAADRVSLDSQLNELRAIQKLSEVGTVGDPGAPSGGRMTPSEPIPSRAAVEPPMREPVKPVVESSPPEPVWTAALPDAPPPAAEKPSTPEPVAAASGATAGAAPDQAAAPAPAAIRVEPARTSTPPAAARPTPSQDRLPLDSVAAAASAASGTGRGRSSKTPAGGVSRSRTDQPKTDQAKTLKCPECGTPNYPTEWYCERCGGELATM